MEAEGCAKAVQQRIEEFRALDVRWVVPPNVPKHAVAAAVPQRHHQKVDGKAGRGADGNDQRIDLREDLFRTSAYSFSGSELVGCE